MAVHFASIGLLVWHARQDARERNTPASASARP
jgi:hypothetical protein